MPTDRYNGTVKNPNMLIIVSGPDRVGKSTLIDAMMKELDGDCYVAHHGPPPSNQKNIFDFYREDIAKWGLRETHAIFDRAYPCSYILEQHRRHNAGHFEDVIDFEIELADQVENVVHLAVLRPWHWSAPLHVQELRELFPDASPWFIRDEYIARMQEHELYTQQLLNFYENITMFPNVQLHDKQTNARAALALCLQALKRTCRSQ